MILIKGLMSKGGRQKNNLRIIITGGGTGGHLFPGIALADAVLDRLEGSEVMFIGTDRQLDTSALETKSYKVASIHCSGLKGKSFRTRFLTLAGLPRALSEAAGLIREFQPSLVFGVGGYVTGPVILAARLKGIATCIHEQNSVPGLANRMLGRLVDRVFLSIPGCERYFPARKTVVSGNPVREELLRHAANNAETKKGVTLLVLGGSQGAHRVNTLVTGAIDTFINSLPDDFRIIHQTGVQDEKMVRDIYARLGVTARVAAFFPDMGEIYNEADLVVSRAGATTLAELMLLGKPSILVPYPYAADDHQAKNGQYFVDGGAAKMYLEKDLTEVRMGKEIVNLLHDPDLRNRMAGAAERLAKPHATEKILEECMALLAGRGFTLGPLNMHNPHV